MHLNSKPYSQKICQPDLRLASFQGIITAFQAYGERLHSLYDKIPQTVCRGDARCCTLIPEITFLEAASALHLLHNMHSGKRHEILDRIVFYFLLNPVKIMSCPFLEQGRCLIYEDRFLGCRTYGLWSGKYYSQAAEKNITARSHVNAAWKKAGVIIPSETAEFKHAYCNNVKVCHGKKPADRAMLKLGRRVAKLSSDFFPGMHEKFNSFFFMDISFWLVSQAKGPEGAALAKFHVVKDTLQAGNRTAAMEAAAPVVKAIARLF